MHVADSLCLCTFVFFLFPGSWQQVARAIGYIWLLIKPVKRFPYAGSAGHAVALVLLDRPGAASPPRAGKQTQLQLEQSPFKK